ncbi:MAG: hypothetical protein Ta2E_01320 [Mycoplasmoidaceae bacterium]|nr:MAG: hypothetical protein Ta2E_01320 [Mycoplasmoidaceae bacterium]
MILIIGSMNILVTHKFFLLFLLIMINVVKKSSSKSLNLNLIGGMILVTNTLKFNESDMISEFHDYYSDHIPNKEENIDADYRWQIEYQKLAAERNQRRF